MCQFNNNVDKTEVCMVVVYGPLRGMSVNEKDNSSGSVPNSNSGLA